MHVDFNEVQLKIEKKKSQIDQTLNQLCTHDVQFTLRVAIAMCVRVRSSNSNEMKLLDCLSEIAANNSPWIQFLVSMVVVKTKCGRCEKRADQKWTKNRNAVARMVFQYQQNDAGDNEKLRFKR